METREYFLDNGVKICVITFEEHIANIFRILNDGEEFVDTISFGLLSEYFNFIKKEFDMKGININTNVGFWGYKEIFDHGIFGPYKIDLKSDHYDGFAIVKPLSQEKYMEMYMNHLPDECRELLTSGKLSNHVRLRNRCYSKPQSIFVEVRSLQNAK